MSDDGDNGSGGDGETPNPESEPLLDGQTIEKNDDNSDSKDFDSEE